MNKQIRSREFRYIYSNAVKLQFNGTDFMLTVGIKEDLSNNTDDEIFEEATIILSPTSAKLWGLMINAVIESAEKSTGHEIIIDKHKLDILQSAIEKAENSKPNI